MFATIIDYVVSVVTQTINLLGVPVVINELAELYTEHKYSFKKIEKILDQKVDAVLAARAARSGL